MAGDGPHETTLWSMLFADDTGLASQSAARLAKMMAAVQVCNIFGMTTENTTETMLLRPPDIPTQTLKVERAGQRYVIADGTVRLPWGE